MKQAYFLLIACCVLALVPASAPAVTCLANSSVIQDWANTQPPGPDGLTHVSIGFVASWNGAQATPANVNQATYQSLMQAVQSWNAVSSSTGVWIDPWFPDPNLPVNEPDIAVVSTSDSDALGCAAYTNETSQLAYGPTFEGLINSSGSNLSLPQGIWAHEIGHALGLADAGVNPSPPTIMNNGTNCGPPAPPTMSPLASDGAQVSACTTAAKEYLIRLKEHQTRALLKYFSPTTSSEFSYTCTETYASYDYYMNGDYEYTTDVLVSSTCNGGDL
jgi:hypothetical protein